MFVINLTITSSNACQFVFLCVVRWVPLSGAKWRQKPRGTRFYWGKGGPRAVEKWGERERRSDEEKSLGADQGCFKLEID